LEASVLDAAVAAAEWDELVEESGAPAASGEPGKKEDVADAEFTEVDDDKKKSA